MLTNKNIVIDPDKRLRTKCSEVTFPLGQEDTQLINDLREYVINSLDDEKCEKYDISPAVGIAAPQVGVTKQMCVVYIEFIDEENNKKEIIDLQMINPKIMAYSEENIYLENGEACLSIKEKHEGIVHRHAYIKVRYYDLSGKKHIIEAYDFLAIAIQHEIDHLNGILFYDHINKLSPFTPKPNSFPL